MTFWLVYDADSIFIIGYVVVPSLFDNKYLRIDQNFKVNMVGIDAQIQWEQGINVTILQGLKTS